MIADITGGPSRAIDRVRQIFRVGPSKIRSFSHFDWRTDFSDERQSNVNFKLTNLPPEAKCALYRVITGEVEVPQLSVDVRYELGKVGFVKPAFGHTPDEFNEQHRPFIEQWFKLNPL